MRLVPKAAPPRGPTTIKSAPYGAVNPKTAVRPPLTPSITTQGTPLALEHFEAPSSAPWAAPWAASLKRLQQKISAAVAANKRAPDANGALVGALQFVGGTPLTISHGLGQPWIGYRVQNVQGAGATFFAAAPTSGLVSSFIVITASMTCTADVWIYASS